MHCACPSTRSFLHGFIGLAIVVLASACGTGRDGNSADAVRLPDARAISVQFVRSLLDREQRPTAEELGPGTRSGIEIWRASDGEYGAHRILRTRDLRFCRTSAGERVGGDESDICFEIKAEQVVASSIPQRYGTFYIAVDPAGLVVDFKMFGGARNVG